MTNRQFRRELNNFAASTEARYKPDQCAQRGAAWLDAVEPGWRDQVNLERLNIEDPTSCVCGQVFAGRGGFPHAAARLGLWGCLRHGFITVGMVPLDALNNAWREQIHAGQPIHEPPAPGDALDEPDDEIDYDDDAANEAERRVMRIIRANAAWLRDQVTP